MGDFLKQFFGFLIFSPLTAAVFGFGIWILPAVFLRDFVARLRLRFFHFFVSGYVFIAITTLYLLAVGSRTKSGGPRHHEVGPFLGMLGSLALAWWLNRLLGDRLSSRKPTSAGGPGGPAGPPPGYPAANQPGYGHPGYRPQPGYPPQQGYPPHPGYPAYPPSQPAPPPTPAAPPSPGGTPNQPRTPGVPWVVPPPTDPTPPTTPTE